MLVVEPNIWHTKIHKMIRICKTAEILPDRGMEVHGLYLNDR